MLLPVEEIKGLFIFEPNIFSDNRGYFFESYNNKDFMKNGIDFKVLQQNQSKSGYGTIRGLHYQAGNFPQAKFVRIIRGEILDVAVDIRANSPTFGKYFSIVLNSENKKGLYIPVGFAHGFSVLSDYAEVFYCCDNYYDRNGEGGIIYNDPSLCIDWQIDLDKACLSEKDKNQNSFQEYKNNMVF
ncbi:dTDP-4-dehydrorhamnose 3,5-epimerase [Vibrio spartinae]|uniref:dTDP-4-dehydrorhamnose 3,5-epimerase n=2 Tax=Vibrio spartinae TaxID=1918945 RepID=A0A1N6M2Q6_9VIBR|nr:dTDP-4-dehydrorhamnose 3,5-epimerase [Vibrio spartinae]